MPSNTVILGNITFTRREVPDIMPWGGKQMLAIHKQIGGQRVIDAMGPDPRPIEWSGLFYGPDASTRARAVDAMKDAGQQVALQWGSFNYTVVIASFEPEYKHEFLVHYRISCEVVTQGPALPTPTLDQQITSDLAAVNAMTALPTSVTAPIATLQNAVNSIANAQPTKLIQDASLASLQAAVSAAQAAFFAAISAQDKADAAVVGLNLDALVYTSVADANANFLKEQANQAAASDILIAIGYLGRIYANLQYAGG